MARNKNAKVTKCPITYANQKSIPNTNANQKLKTGGLRLDLAGHVTFNKINMQSRAFFNISFQFIKRNYFGAPKRVHFGLWMSITPNTSALECFMHGIWMTLNCQIKRVLLVFIHVMRRLFWCTKQWQNVAHVSHNSRIKFPKDFFGYFSVHQQGRRDVQTENNSLDLQEANLQDIRQYSNRPKRTKKRRKTIMRVVSIVLI